MVAQPSQASSLIVPVVLLVQIFPIPNAAASELSKTSFIFLSAREASRLQLLGCPNHAFGTMDDGIKEIERRLLSRPASAISFIQLCVSDQIRSIERCAPLVDISAINPFVMTSSKTPASHSRIWPTCDDPLVNRLRELTTAAGEHRLLARIDLGGIERGFFRERLPSFDEITWMVYAAIGAQFKGVVWVGDASFPSHRLARLERQILCHAEGLGVARPVSWVRSGSNQHISALASESELFVCLLNPNYMHLTGQRKCVDLPLWPTHCTFVLELIPPQRVRILSARTISGSPVYFKEKDGGIEATHEFVSGAEMLVFQTAALPDPKDPCGDTDSGQRAARGLHKAERR